MISFVAFSFLIWTSVNIAMYEPEPPKPTMFRCSADGGTVYIYCHKEKCTCPDIFLIKSD